MLRETEGNFIRSFKGMADYHGGKFASDAQRDFIFKNIIDKILQLESEGFTADEFWEEIQNIYPEFVEVPAGTCAFETSITTSTPPTKNGDEPLVMVVNTYTVIDYNGVIAMYQQVIQNGSIKSIKEKYKRDLNEVQFVSLQDELKNIIEQRSNQLQSVRIPQVRTKVKGKVVSSKTKEEHGSMGWRSVYKMVVKTDIGFSAWGTIPTSIIDQLNEAGLSYQELKGMEVEFTASFSPSKDDPLFAFFKRPSNASVSEKSIALTLLRGGGENKNVLDW